MPPNDRVVIRVSTASIKLIKEVAIDRDLDIGAAADYLIGVGRSRLEALARFNEAKRKKSKKTSPKTRKTK
jgi:hypothetical protein